jgi:mitochondrial import inner membrane translocase subunit TIM22
MSSSEDQIANSALKSLPPRKVPSVDPSIVALGSGAAVGTIFPRATTWTIPIKDEEAKIDPQTLFQYCGFKVVSGGVMGALVGIAMGAFLSAMSNDVSHVQMHHGREVPPAPLREQMRGGIKGFSSKTRGWAKSFGILTALFEGTECAIEKARGKHDVWNQASSGCIVGATLASSGGPGAACFGCAGFATFSILIDKIMGPH